MTQALICLEGVVLDATSARGAAALATAHSYPGIAGPLPGLTEVLQRLRASPSQVGELIAMEAIRAAASADAPMAVVEPILVRLDFEALYWGRGLFTGAYGRGPRLIRELGYIEGERPLRDASDLAALVPVPRVALSTRPRVEVLYSLLRFGLTTCFDAVLCREDVDAGDHGTLRRRLLRAARERSPAPPVGVYAVVPADQAAARSEGLAVLGARRSTT